MNQATIVQKLLPVADNAQVNWNYSNVAPASLLPALRGQICSAQANGD